jgi:tRNA-binding protein
MMHMEERLIPEEIDFNYFKEVGIYAGTIIHAEKNQKAVKPALVLEIDFGVHGKRKSSARITENYSPDDLIGIQVIAVLNFPPKKIAGINSEVLIMAVLSQASGIVLIKPDRPVENGSRVM